MESKYHKILIKAPDFGTAQQGALSFFETTPLHYDHMEVVAEQSYRVSDPQFWPALHAGIAENQGVLEEFVHELRDTGCATMESLAEIKQGYPSKILHLIAHILDGFVGVDTVFYNLPEDSHWLSESLQKFIKGNQDLYWLLHLEVTFAIPGAGASARGQAGC